MKNSQSNQKQQIIIIGAGGHGKEITSYIKDLSVRGQDIDLVGFVDEKKPAGPWEGMKILGNFRKLKEFLHKNQKEQFYYITATGDNSVRQHFVKEVEALKARNLSPWILCHPDTCVGEHCHWRRDLFSPREHCNNTYEDW